MKIQVYISFGKILPKWLPFFKEEKYSQVNQLLSMDDFTLFYWDNIGFVWSQGY